MCRPCSDGGEADDAATTDGGRPAVAGAGGDLHGKTQSQTQTIATLEGKFQYFSVILSVGHNNTLHSPPLLSSGVFLTN